MEAIDLFGLLIPVTFFAMFAIERLWPARSFPDIKFWNLTGVFFLMLMAALASTLPLVIPMEWQIEHRLMDGSRLGVVPGAIVGYVFYSFVAYWYHRATHVFPWLWRFTHQLHHSPQRLDMAGAVFFHPFDITLYIFMSVITSSLVLGLDPLAAAITGYIASFYSYFQHMNINTPKWLGYVIQRPEAHCIHHQRNVHAFNYGDFPLWDILFGTFQNPASFAGEVGFDSPKSQQVAKILLCQDVHNQQMNFGLPKRNVVNTPYTKG